MKPTTLSWHTKKSTISDLYAQAGKARLATLAAKAADLLAELTSQPHLD
jgi:hypothetical protein